jgi:GT2 family glycosyltransferase
MPGRAPHPPAAAAAAEPLFSIVTPVFDPPAPVLRRMLASVRRQRLADWEHCLVDDASTSAAVVDELVRAAAADPRVRVVRRAVNGGIVAASNDGLALARGRFVALLDHDDELHLDALAAVAEVIARRPEVDYVYSDEDKIDESGRRSGPFFKPDWAPDRFRTQMYTCHLSVLRRALVEEVGGFDPAFEGAQDWDLVLRVTERARAVAHVPRVLYHWRTLAGSTSGTGVAAKPWAYDAGTRALQSHCDRTAFPAVVDHDRDNPGVYRLTPRLTRHAPVSIVIPTAGTVRAVRGVPTRLVDHCVRSIVETSTYPDYEVVVVADTTVDDATRAGLAAIAGDRLTLVPYDAPFNYAEKINLGVRHAGGEHVLMLNDDIEVATPGWIERLVMYAGAQGVGAVGARLLYEDGRLQHAGVVFRDGLPGHLYRGFPAGTGGYANEVLVAGDFLAVTGACLMTPRAAFDAVGGLNEDFPLNYNDTDYCLRLGARGLRVVYDPGTVLYHFESASRPSGVSPEEDRRFRDRWGAAVAVDPFDNPNFDRRSLHRVLPRPLYRRVPGGLARRARALARRASGRATGHQAGEQQAVVHGGPAPDAAPGPKRGGD